jgi:hypothetical protein
LRQPSEGASSFFPDFRTLTIPCFPHSTLQRLAPQCLWANLLKGPPSDRPPPILRGRGKRSGGFRPWKSIRVGGNRGKRNRKRTGRKSIVLEGQKSRLPAEQKMKKFFSRRARRVRRKDPRRNKLQDPAGTFWNFSFPVTSSATGERKAFAFG